MIVDFNRDWYFYKENTSEKKAVALPHDAMISENRYARCRSGVSGAFFPGGIYTYEKEFIVERQWAGKYIALHFEGVYQSATVSVNGKTAAYHRYGYTEFTADISDLVEIGKNTVRVVADNSLVPNCRWYTGGGIYRPVWLEVCEKRHIEDIFVKTLSHDPATIEVSAKYDGALRCEIFDGDQKIAEGEIGTFTLAGAALWSERDPHLYTLRVTGETDTRTVRFGIRTIARNAKDGFLVNGVRTLLRGGCIHHDNGVLGACSYYDAEYRRVKIMKEQGFNALRISHNPASRALLRACDELGMYVIDEAFDGWYTPKEYHDYSRVFFSFYREDLDAMVKKDRNHPSVVMYSVGNEVTETAEEKGVRLCAELRDCIRAADDTRPVTCGINILLNYFTKKGYGVYRDSEAYEAKPLPEDKVYREKKSGSAFFNAQANRLSGMFFSLSKTKLAEQLTNMAAPSVDIMGLNYASSRYDIDAVKYPERMMLGTETMVGALPYNWPRVQKYPQLIGDFVWAAWDYLGEACIGDWTYHSYPGLPLLAGQGMIDITGKPLAAMAFMQVVWGLRKKPYLCVRPLDHAGEIPTTSAWQFTNAIDSWSWRGFEGKKALVEVYSPGERIELYLNGRRIGRKKLKEYKAVFKVEYQNGVLRAVALNEKGERLAEHCLATGGAETRLTLRAEKKKIKRGELAFVAVEFTDDAGELKPYLEKSVKIVAGNGLERLGYGSALCKTDELFASDTHTTYRGRAFAVFQGKQTGVFTVTASCGGVPAATVSIEVV